MIANDESTVFRPVEGHANGVIGYLIADPSNGVAVVVDPPPGETELILALLAESRLQLVMALRTHVHAQDMERNLCPALCERTRATLVIGGVSARTVPPGVGVRQVRNGDILSFGAEHLRVISTPGHTPDCVSYLWRDRLLCGDVFDLGSCVAEDGQGDPALQYDSFTRRIFPLPDATLVFPAHPIRKRRVFMLAELKARLTPVVGSGRDAFIADMTQQRAANAHHTDRLRPPR